MNIKIFTTGGTIDKVYFDSKSTYEIGESMVAELLREANVSLAYEVQPLLRKDSLDMTDANRELVRGAVERDMATHVLITHGTDTMRETALKLKDIPGKTIVLTGSMQPARFRSTDAIFNVGSALAALQLLKPGVYIVINGRVFDPAHCRKNREENRFEEC
jgi:L-asparaginase